MVHKKEEMASFPTYLCIMTAMKRLLFVIQALTLPVFAEKPVPKNPNFIVIMVDDMGYSDIGCFGGEVKTPNLDALAKSGMRFTQFYNTAKCHTTRAELLTGNYAYSIGDNKMEYGATFGEVMGAHGYRTICSGKWHQIPLPTERGFDRYYGLADGCSNFFNPGLKARDGEGPPGRKGQNRVRRWAIEDKVIMGYTDPDPNFYHTDNFTNYAIDRLEEYKTENKPFVLYLPYTAPHYIASQNVHLVAELSKSRVYINEPVTVVYKLYFGGKVRPSDVSPIDMPEYKDFWSQDIPSRRTIDREMYKGKLYNFVAWQQTVLYPQRAGKLPIAPLTLDVQLDVPTNRRDFFGNEIYTQVSRTITAGKRTLNVLPFPEEGKPNTFNGAVGTFELEVKTSKNALNASESLQATVQVTGKGNLKLFSLPELVTPSALERYDPEHNEQVNTTLSGMRGNIQDTYTLVPQFQGKYPIPPVRFSYFDPSSKSYKTLTSEEVVIDVIEGPKSVGTVASNTSTATAVEVPAISNAFQFIAQRASFKSIVQPPFLGSTLFYVLLLLPVLLLVIYLALRKRTPDAALVAQRHKAKLVKKYLGKAKRNMSDATDFYVALEAALHNYVKARLHIQTADFSKEKMENLLTEKGVDTQTVALFIRVLTNCEFARYTPSSRSSMEQDYATAVEAITQMDKQF